MSIQRGGVPEAGSVLTFRANGRMRLGHVAVVSQVINPREIEIDHANWWGPGMRGGVARNIPVVDVSEANDWTAVRVGLGQSGEFGSVYPTYGFIYDRPDNGVMLAATGARAAARTEPCAARPAPGRRTRLADLRGSCRGAQDAETLPSRHRPFAQSCVRDGPGGRPEAVGTSGQHAKCAQRRRRCRTMSGCRRVNRNSTAAATVIAVVTGSMDVVLISNVALAAITSPAVTGIRPA